MQLQELIELRQKRRALEERLADCDALASPSRRQRAQRDQTEDELSKVERAIAAGEAERELEHPGLGSFDARGANDGRSSRLTERSEFLGAEQRMSDWIAERGVTTVGAGEFSLGRFAHAMISGGRSHLSDAELRGMTEGTLADGGYLLGPELAGEVIDLLRARAQTLAAGVRVVPMATNTLYVPRGTSAGAATWHAESQADLAASGMGFERLEFSAKTVAALWRMSRELAEDLTPVGAATIEAEIARSLAMAVDYAVLRGSAPSTPLGVRYQSGVNLITTYAGSAPSDFGPWLAAVAAVRDANGRPTAFIQPSKLQTTLDEFVDTTGQPLVPPRAVAELPMLISNRIPSNLGAGEDESEIYCCDWSAVWLGVRPSIGARLIRLEERYAESLDVGLLTWLRVDVQLQHPSWCSIVSTVKH